MTIELRPIRQGDFEFAWWLYESLMRPLTEELLPWREDKQMAVVQEAVESGEAHIILVDGCPAGWLQIREDTDRIYLAQIYVAPAHQGRGVATLLIRGLIDRAAAEKKLLELSVMKNNRAKELYDRLGFRVVTDDAHKFHMRWADGCR